MQQHADLIAAKEELNTLTKNYNKSSKNVSDLTEKLITYRREYEQLQRKLDEFNREMLAIETKFTESSLEDASLNMKVMISKAGSSKWDTKVREFERVRACSDMNEDTPSIDESLEDEEIEANLLKSIHAQKDAINELFKLTKH